MTDLFAEPGPESSAGIRGDSRGKRAGQRAVLFLGISCGVACLAAEGIRIHELLVHGNLIETTGGEAPCIYGVWKVLHGHVLYEWPDRTNFCLTLYNYLFYHLYAYVIGLWPGDDQRLMVVGRLLTLAAAAAGMAGQWALVRLAAPGPWRRPMTLFVASLCLATWVGPTTGWFSLSVRPDMVALALSTWAFWLVLRAHSGKSEGSLLIAASLIFLLAWSVKQSAISMFVGSLAVVMTCGPGLRLRRTLLVGGPFVVLAAGTLTIGGPEYVRNIIWAPSLSPLQASALLRNLAVAFATNPFLRFFGILCADWKDRPNSTLARKNLRRSLWTASVVSLTLCALAAAKEGSSQNQLLEASILFGVISVSALMSSIEEISPWRLTLAAGSLTPALVLPLMQAFAQVSAGEGMRWSAARISDGRYLERSALASQLGEVPKPLLSEDPIFALPWIASNDRYPAFEVDPVFYGVALRNGMLAGGGIASLVQRGYFGALLLQGQSHLESAAKRSGYSRRGAEFIVPDSFNSGDDDTFQIWILDKSRPQ